MRSLSRRNVRYVNDPEESRDLVIARARTIKGGSRERKGRRGRRDLRSKQAFDFLYIYIYVYGKAAN